MEEQVFKCRAFLITETVTGELRTRVFSLEEELVIVDGDGEAWRIDDGNMLVVVEVPFTAHATGAKLLDTAERYFHGLWGHRPHAEPTRTTFDVRTAQGGRRPDAGVPF